MARKHTFAFGEATAVLERADSVAYLKDLKSTSIDLMVTSPPYFIGKEYDRSTHVIDFEKTILRLLPEIQRILKPGGSICWQLGNYVCRNEIIPLDYVAANAMATIQSFCLRNRIIWTYSHGTNERRRFSGRHETILWYTYGDNYYFDLDLVRVPQKYPGKRHYKGPRKGNYSGNPRGKNPGDYWDFGAIWDIPNVKANHVEKTEHPCQYPIALVRRLILALCPIGGSVLDPFVGSGTTAVAALLDGRNFVGCDVVDTYLSIAESRIEALLRGELRFRHDMPIQEPTTNCKLSIVPQHFEFIAGARNANNDSSGR